MLLTSKFDDMDNKLKETARVHGLLIDLYQFNT